MVPSVSQFESSSSPVQHLFWFLHLQLGVFLNSYGNLFAVFIPICQSEHVSLFLEVPWWRVKSNLLCHACGGSPPGSGPDFHMALPPALFFLSTLSFPQTSLFSQTHLPWQPLFFFRCCISTGQSLPPPIQLSSLHWNTAFSVKPLLIPQTDVKAFSLRYPLYLVLTSSVTIASCYGLHVFFLPKLNSRTGLCCHFDHSKPSTGLGAYEILFEWINQVDIVNKNKMSFLGLSLFQS